MSRVPVGWLVCALALACHDPAGPSATDLTGAWTGASSYPNAPFQLSLSQTGATLKGEYHDTLDHSLAVSGTVSRQAVAVVVDFGDAKLNLEGTLQDAQTIRGDMFTSALGNRRYPFTLTR